MKNYNNVVGWQVQHYLHNPDRSDYAIDTQFVAIYRRRRRLIRNSYRKWFMRRVRFDHRCKTASSRTNPIWEMMEIGFSFISLLYSWQRAEQVDPYTSKYILGFNLDYSVKHKSFWCWNCIENRWMENYKTNLISLFRLTCIK